MNALTATRRFVLAIWLCLIAFVVAAVVVAHVAPLLGYRPVIIQGPSMSPTIPVGALIFESKVPVTEVKPGDVVTFTTPTGTVITHRVVSFSEVDGNLQFETKGDANPAPDPSLHSANAINGVVRFSVPMAGFLLAYLTLPTGILSVVSMLGSLLVSLWLLEDLANDRQEAPADPARMPDGLTA
jgi:signal peptidase I